MKDGRRHMSDYVGDLALGVDSRRASGEPGSSQLGADVTLLAVTGRVDARGRLVEFDFSTLPFTVRRVFVVTDVPPGTERGGHRHRRGVQALFCTSGRVEVELRRGDVRWNVWLTPATGALVVRAGVWARQRYVEEGSQLLVLASEPYDAASYDTEY